MLKKIFCLLLIFNLCYGEEKESNVVDNFYDYNVLSVDEHLSSPVGSNLVLTSYNFFGNLTNIYGYDFDGYGIDIFFRTSNLLFIQFPIASYHMIFNHEVFGHGARLRELGYKQGGYDVGILSGAAYFEPKANAHPHEDAVVSSGGIETSTFLSETLAMKMFSQGEADYKNILLYILTNGDLIDYISYTDGNSYSNGNDIMGYIEAVNKWHGKEAVSLKYLKKANVFNYMNMFYGNALIGLCSYAIENQYKYKLPNIMFVNYRLSLAPYGPEHGVNVYFKDNKERIYKVHAKAGSTGGLNSSGLGLEAHNILYNDNYSIGARGVVWHQPELLVSRNSSSTQFGAGAYAILMYRLIDSYTSIGGASSSPVNLIANIGYKTKGYVEAEPLRAGFVVKVGFGIKM